MTGVSENLIVPSRDVSREVPLALIHSLNAKARAQGWTFICDQERYDEPKLNDVLALWQARAAVTEIPSRADFSARDLKSVLPDLLISDVITNAGNTRFRYRYVGTRVAQMMGEMTGQFMDVALKGTTLDRTAACYQTVVKVREPLRFVTKFSLDTVSYLGAEVLAAPLATDHNSIDMLMAVIHFRRPD